MKLWLVSQDVNNGYDTIDSAVVCAETEEAARRVKVGTFAGTYPSWARPEHVKARYIGEADQELSEGEIICASFNAG